MTLVLGIGNPLRSDDGVAWKVAEAIEPTPGVRVATLHQPVPEWAEEIARASRVVFVDASAVESPGAVRVRSLEARPTGNDLTHAIEPADLLALAKNLYGTCPRASLVTVGGRRFEHGSELSPEAEAGAGQAVATVRRLLESDGEH